MKRKAVTFSGEGEDLIRAFQERLTYRNYSNHTVTNYVKELNHLCVYYASGPKQITEDQLHDYLYHLSANEGFGPNKISLAMASFAHFYWNVAKTPDKVKKLRPPKIPRRVPLVITPGQVYEIIEGLDKLRDKVLIQLLYSTGIRVSECVMIRLHDINKERKVLHVEKGKGKKTRYVPLSPMMLDQIELYRAHYEPRDYLFYRRGRKYDMPMNRATINRVVRKAKVILNTNAEITPHTLRHSFATTLVEEGENLVKIQKILGHKSLMTTVHYTKSAKPELNSCVNPLDKVYQEKKLENTVFEL